jgi:hypothetical protein
MDHQRIVSWAMATNGHANNGWIEECMHEQKALELRMNGGWNTLDRSNGLAKVTGEIVR